MSVTGPEVLAAVCGHDSSYGCTDERCRAPRSDLRACYHRWCSAARCTRESEEAQRVLRDAIARRRRLRAAS